MLTTSPPVSAPRDPEVSFPSTDDDLSYRLYPYSAQVYTLRDGTRCGSRDVPQCTAPRLTPDRSHAASASPFGNQKVSEGSRNFVCDSTAASGEAGMQSQV